MPRAEVRQLTKCDRLTPLPSRGAHEAKHEHGRNCNTRNDFSRRSLNASLPEVPKLFAGLVLASGAGHGGSPLAFCEETSQNSFGSEAWVTTRFGLAPTPVSVEAGALN